CALLSGGLDSTALASEAVLAHPNLRTFAAGAIEDVEDEAASDLTFARRAAEALGAAHDQAPITRERFRKRWPWLVEQQGLPLSTPNEVAIYTVARRLRDEGCVVTLSGEGADELLAGYEGPLDSAWRFEQTLAEQNASGDAALRARALFQLESNAWAPSRLKPLLLREPVLRASQGDEPLVALYEQLFRQAAAEAPCAEPLAAHLRFQQLVNLTGLLQRLDSATMQASVEGRTPYADAHVAQLAHSLPMPLLYEPPPPVSDGPGALAVAAAPRTKLLLRRAFAHRVPREILERPKASFPLPFQRWIADHAPTLQRSAFAREVFTPDAIAMVARDPTSQWRLAWPMINLAMWGDRWWG
ncbi:MAG: asparagine synthase, partial [Planctomycetota bacterium]